MKFRVCWLQHILGGKKQELQFIRRWQCNETDAKVVYSHHWLNLMFRSFTIYEVIKPSAKIDL